jgi:pimeloyl-ACP methyl ester carboxylesterase
MVLATPIPVRRSLTSLANGRVLDVAVAGPEDGTLLVFQHGTPGSLILFEPFIKAAVARGLRYLSYSRPGYGGSSRQAGRTVADCSTDMGRIIDQFGVDCFFVIGWSGVDPTH